MGDEKRLGLMAGDEGVGSTAGVVLSRRWNVEAISAGGAAGRRRVPNSTDRIASVRRPAASLFSKTTNCFCVYFTYARGVVVVSNF